MLIKGASFPKSSQVGADRKLSVALDLYSAFFTEQSANARFLTLIMSLEALAIGTCKAPLALELLAKWSSEVEALLKSVPPNSGDAVSLEALNRELLFRREDSVRSQVRKLVLSALLLDADANDMARAAVDLYDLRSKLVHDGALDARTLDVATSEAKSLVHRVLLIRFQRVTQGE
ncbi:MAG: hypothetical protein H0V78_01855 [Burkholderiales bacterium]|nr:hypothetical protein [Burkholderiales bacterium]